MQIQVNTDNHIHGSAGLAQQIEELLVGKLKHFSPRITRLEVHLSDESSSVKSSDDDKRCLIEARLMGMDPVSVSDRSGSVLQAAQGATKKLQSLLESMIGKLEDRR
ncbi:MAG: ribosomal subunit interface protein [Pirellulales bacterium]